MLRAIGKLLNSIDIECVFGGLIEQGTGEGEKVLEQGVSSLLG